MRFLHTSDWHLGRGFHGESMLPAQRDVLEKIVQTAREHAVDTVLIAGDVYDRSVPPEEAVAMFEEALEALDDAGIAVVVTSGNHDSARRLGFAGRFMTAGGLHFRTRLQDADAPVRFTQTDSAGSVVQHVDVFGIPYLEPRAVAAELEVDSVSHQAVVAAAVDRVRDAAQRRAQEQVQDHAQGHAQTHNNADAGNTAADDAAPLRSVVMAHLFAAGGTPTESEAVLAVGQVDRVSAGLFEWTDYTALGHLHGPQQPLPHVRYSGSPLPYSFSEATQAKGGWIVDLEPGEEARCTWVEWPAPRKLALLRGPLEELLQDPEHAWAEEAYCQVTLTDAERPARPMERLRERFPLTLVIHFDSGSANASAHTYRTRLATAQSPQQVAEGFLEFVRDRKPTRKETSLVEALLEQATIDAGNATAVELS